jgi:hypothetical protein
MMPVKEEAPNFPITQVTNKSEKKAAKSHSTGSPNNLKPSGPNVKLSEAHNAQKTLIKVMSAVFEYVVVAILESPVTLILIKVTLFA